MKQSVMLTIASLLSILLLTLHITDDIVRGISKAESSNIALAVLVVLLYGTLVLAERLRGISAASNESGTQLTITSVSNRHLEAQRHKDGKPTIYPGGSER